MKISSVGAAICRPHLTKPYSKRDNGITVISLIITIIVMLILAAVTISVGTENIDKAHMTNFVSYMQLIQAKVDFIAEYEEYSNYGEELNDENKKLLQEILSSQTESFLTTTSSSELKFFDSSHIASDLEIENIDDEIVVDFNTREVISLTGIKYEDAMYFTQYNLPGGQVLKQNTQEVTRNVSFEDIIPNIDGLNATFTITNLGITNGTLSYGTEYVENEETKIKWTTITNYTTKGKSITTRNITESGTYYFKLVDNTNGDDNVDEEGNYPSVELRLTNSPKLEGNFVLYDEIYNYSDLKDSTKWAFATDTTDEVSLVYYVWIPRFAYKLNAANKLEELQFLRGNSDVTTSGGYINSTEWTVPDEFTEGGVQKTGVWVQVSSAKQKDLDIIDILITGMIL